MEVAVGCHWIYVLHDISLSIPTVYSWICVCHTDTMFQAWMYKHQLIQSFMHGHPDIILYVLYLYTQCSFCYLTGGVSLSLDPCRKFYRPVLGVLLVP